MSLCVLCGNPTFGPETLCRYHTASYGDDWARGNRIICDFVHRGIVSAPSRSSEGRSRRGQELLRSLAQL